MFHRLSRTACRSLLATASLGILVLLLTHHNDLQTPSFRIDSVLGDLYDSSHKHEPDLIASSQLQNAKAQNFWLKLHSALRHANPHVNSIEPSRPHIEQSFNEIWPDLVHEESIRVSVEEKEQLRTNHQKFVDNLGEVGELFPFTRRARGIVTTAGEKYVNALLVSLRVLRRVGSKLPVEVFFDAQTESTDRVCNGMLKKLNAECRFFSDVWIATPDTTYLKSFQLKVFALLFSSFEDVLFLDADAFPARNPDQLLKVEPYMSMGLVTWPDFWSTTTSPTFWEIASVSDGVAKKEQDARASTESGVMLVSKAKHANTLLLAAYYNYYGPGCYYPLLSQGAQGEG
jgi:alpha 1,2-mannosyltransferase